MSAICLNEPLIVTLADAVTRKLSPADKNNTNSPLIGALAAALSSATTFLAVVPSNKLMLPLPSPRS